MLAMMNTAPDTYTGVSGPRQNSFVNTNLGQDTSAPLADCGEHIGRAEALHR